jgi:hypothetical protein
MDTDSLHTEQTLCEAVISQALGGATVETDTSLLAGSKSFGQITYISRKDLCHANRKAHLLSDEA